MKKIIITSIIIFLTILTTTLLLLLVGDEKEEVIKYKSQQKFKFVQPQAIEEELEKAQKKLFCAWNKLKRVFNN